MSAAPAQAWKCATYRGVQDHNHSVGVYGTSSYWWADQTDSAGHMSFGPYDSQWRYGPHTAIFTIGFTGSTGGTNHKIVTVDVVTNYGQKVLGTRSIHKSDFKNGRSVQNFSIDFDDPAQGVLETRVYFTDKAGPVQHYRSAVCGESRWQPYPNSN